METSDSKNILEHKVWPMNTPLPGGPQNSHPHPMQRTCDASEAGILGRWSRLVTGLGCDVNVVRGRKIQIHDLLPGLGDIPQRAAIQSCDSAPVTTADVQLESLTGAIRAGPLEFQCRLLVDGLTEEMEDRCRLCKTGVCMARSANTDVGMEDRQRLTMNQPHSPSTIGGVNETTNVNHHVG